MIEPREVAKGQGWRVFRLGKSFCVSLERTDAPDMAEVWVSRAPDDIARGSLLGAFLSGAYGAVDSRVAVEAFGANW